MDYNKIDLRRREIRLTQKELCNLAKISTQGLSDIINHKNTTVKTIEKLSQALRVPMSYWWEEDPGNVFMEDQEPNGLSDEERKMYQDVIKNLNKIIKDCEERLENFAHRKRDGTSG